MDVWVRLGDEGLAFFLFSMGMFFFFLSFFSLSFLCFFIYIYLGSCVRGFLKFGWGFSFSVFFFFFLVYR